MEIENLMAKDLIVCRINDSIYDVANMMVKHDIGFIPISKDKKIVGVITDRDIVLRVIANNIDLDSEVENYITNNVISIDIKSNLEEAIDLMGNEKIKRLIVRNSDKVVGIISLSNIVSSNIDSNLLVKNIQKIYTIKRNTDKEDTEIDDFYL